MNPSLDPKDLFDIPDPFAQHARAEVGLPAPDVEALPAAPTRSRTWALRAGAAAGLIVCEALLVSRMGLRPGGVDATVILVGVVLPILAATLTFAAAHSSASRKARIVVMLVACVLAFVLTTFLTRAPGDDSVTGMSACIVATSMMAAGPTLLAVFAMRHAFVTGAAWRTAALGLASGVIGAAATRLYCANDAVPHVLVGHGVPILLATIVAVVLGTRFTRA